MHEAGIIRNVLAMVEEEARSRGAARVTKVRLRVGDGAGVELKSLSLAFFTLRAETMADEAELEIVTVRLRAKCDRCGEVEPSAEDFTPFCPDCGDALEIIAGKELQVESIEIEK